jgi:hypothetical protein
MAMAMAMAMEALTRVSWLRGGLTNGAGLMRDVCLGVEVVAIVV